MKRVLSFWVVLVMLLCAGMSAVAETPVQDRAGNAIVVPEQVDSIIALAPSITQVLVDIGVADKLVAVDTYSADSKELPGGLPAFDMMAPDMEQMVALEPDLVLVSGMSLSDGSDPFTVLTDAGVCVAYVPSSSSIEGILEDTMFIGMLVGKEDEAQALNDTLTEGIEALRIKTDEPVPVFFEISFPYTFGSGTFLNEMIELLGGINIFAEETSWITVSDEAVIAAAPEIIFTNADWNPAAAEEILARPGWESIPAVEKGKVFLINGDTSSQPNHRIIYALEEMAEAFGAR